MSEYDKEWEDYYFYRETGYCSDGTTVEPNPPKLKVGNTISPSGYHAWTGCGVVIKIEANHQDLSPPCVKVLTDFGNVIDFQEWEVIENYIVTGVDKDIKGRIQCQIDSLNKILEGM